MNWEEKNEIKELFPLKVYPFTLKWTNIDSNLSGEDSISCCLKWHGVFIRLFIDIFLFCFPSTISDRNWW